MQSLKKLLEGGNVFKDPQGNALTQRIDQQDVPGTIRWIERVTGIKFPQDRWLGSTGRRPTSGDLDLAVDANEVTKEQLASRLVDFIKRQKQDPASWVKKAGEVHFRVPINGNAAKGFVQADFMFFPDLDWGTFYYSQGSNSAYKGMNRAVLMSSIAKSLGFKVGSNGVFSRATNELVTASPDKLANLILGPGYSRDDLSTVESIYAALANNPERDKRLADFREYLKREGLDEPNQAVQEQTEVNFLARLRDRIVNQGMHALIEHEQRPLREAKEPRIPYVEDLVFKEGLRGAQKALQIIKQTAANTRDYATIKWDGSPAVIFGRKPETGEFVLTDKSGATAVGYDGLATSPEMIGQIMAQRDASQMAQGKSREAGKLGALYQEIWPYFEAAVPKNFRGYLKGDLLYSPQKPWVEHAGNLVFQPNSFGGIVYRIPVNSPLGELIKNSTVGVAIHTQMETPTSAEQPFSDPESMLTPVPGFLATSAVVKNLQNLKLDRNDLAKIIELTSGTNAQALQQFFNPAELRAQQITDLPALMERFINSLKGTDYSDANPSQFGVWLQSNVSPRKYNNIIEYLGSPSSNTQAMQAAFDIWNAIHDMKNKLHQQLDIQYPGQEGWVFAPPAGRAKVVRRTAGGFADPVRKAQARL